MKQTKRAINGIFAFLMITFLFVQCKDQATKEAGEANVINTTDAEHLPLAYVEVDSLLTHFEFYNRLASNYEDKVSKHNSSLNTGYQKLQNEVINFQQKAQNNAFLSQERMLQEQNRIQRMKDDLDKQATQVEQELALDNQLIQQQFSDSLILGMKEFNTPQKYHMIFAKSGNSILYADPQYNITGQVVEFLNKRFKAE
ncbi:MAG: OmpH family outer membrane protein [Dysgonamonadaceae bacterium]|jgi:outer membrane protein|nr:OmpH family outer membrane protein [Dysgonamonadaceae bacterium]